MLVTRFGTISQSIKLPPLLVDYLVVAGGGSGGSGNASGYESGGGGAGGLIYEEEITKLIATVYPVTVGLGGVNANGANSVFSDKTAIGGGKGANGATAGSSGGSGGGGAHNVTAGGAGTSGQGYAGGKPSVASLGGGGGGAGEAGNTDGVAEGGDGKEVSITGTAKYYAGGGAGVRPTYAISSSLGGGGSNTGVNPNRGTAGAVNSGSGGSGGFGPSQVGADGGSGIVILRFPKAYTLTVSAGLTYTDTELDDDKIYSFTAGTGTVEFKAH